LFGIDSCRDKLKKSAGDIYVLKRLTDTGARLVGDAINILVQVQTAHDSRKYQLFLYDILHHSGPGMVLLCAASLGKQRITKLNTNDRVAFVSYVNNNKADLHSPALDLLAGDYRVPSLNSPEPISILIYLKADWQ
jgi:hypothetical protein